MPKKAKKPLLHPWWKEAVVYQVYPRSFRDSDGDGNGDLTGLISKLDHIAGLGVGAIWLCPIYASPMADNGYDVSDYYAVNPLFGTMADFDELVAGLKQRKIRLMMDLVVNHTSVEHPWFRLSRSSRDNVKRDWYIWRDGRDGREPNNWACHFGTSAWEPDALTGQYYLHSFSREQPDLNWDNPAVKREIFKMMRFWLDRGVDAFRMDMGNFLKKAPGLPDAKRLPGDDGAYVHGRDLYANQPGMAELISELRQEVLDPYGAALFGEIYFLDQDSALEYLATDKKRFDLMYQYEIMDARGDWRGIKESVRTWHEAFRGRAWNTIALSNHDSPRPLSTFGADGEYRTEAAKCLATFLLTAPGTPFLLQGEEIGMTNVLFSGIDDYTDIEMKEKFRERLSRGEDPQALFADLARYSRDNARTPMQWNAEADAGFGSLEPWLKVNPNYQDINVAAQADDPNSILNYYRRLIALRRRHKALVYGDYQSLTPDDWETYAYQRIGEKESLLVIINTSPRPWPMQRPAELSVGAKLLISNYPDRADTDTELNLRPWEARVYKIQ